MKKAPLVIIGAIVLVLLFFILCTFVQRPYEAVIVDRAGSLVTPVTLYRNWKLCLPTDTIIRIDTRNHLVTSQLKEMITRDKVTVTVRTYVAWKIIKPETFYLALTDDEKAKARISELLDATTKKKFASHDANEFFNVNSNKILTDAIEREIREELNNGTEENKGLAYNGLEIDQVGFSRIAFPPVVAAAVYDRMAKERDTAAQKHRDEGQTEATKLVNDARVLSETIVARANRDAAVIRGNADREAIAIIGAVTDNQYARDWFEIYKLAELTKESFRRGNNIIMLTPDSQIVKRFFSAESGPPKRPAGISAPPEKRPLPPGLTPTSVPATAPASFDFKFAPTGNIDPLVPAGSNGSLPSELPSIRSNP